ncbi:hypothetical protein [Chryseobacterium sp. WLY505]|uniref:phosphoribosyltransferase-like protein n=1 Tax=Chryseobacterium sp. WLY505 TaxID=3068892 RepID=UPI0027969503|nr:hypothetical protein [Chryseobacterium sp. WLY505]MDQ1855789.1 hypothetical protein [Chryseobacterium sp. WLY505]
MTETILYRSKRVLEYDDFSRLINMNNRFSWLTDNYEGLYELWSHCDNDDEKKLIEFLIDNFRYTTASDLNNSGNSIANQIENIWKLESHNTYIVATCDDRKPDGSQAFIQSIKNKFSITWENNNFYNNLLEAAHKLEDNIEIVLVDDFIGTGDTIKKKSTYLIKKLNERNINNFKIRVVAFAAMEFAKEKIDRLNLEFYSYIWLKKGISELITEQAKRKKAILIMSGLEDKLGENYKNLKLSRLRFGYKQSESLFSLESFNIPNNVFPIFWWPKLNDNKYCKTLFHRL